MSAAAVLGVLLFALTPAVTAQAAPALTPSLGGYVDAGETAPFAFDLVDVAWSSAIVTIELVDGTMSVDTTGLALTLQPGSTSFTDVTEISFTGPLTDVTTALADRLTWTAPATPADSYLRLTISVDSWIAGVAVNPANGHAYLLTTSALSWPAARDAAAALIHNGQQGYLTTVTDAAENTFTAITMGGGVTAWIGATTDIAYVNPLRDAAAQYPSNAAIAGQPHWGAGPEGGQNTSYRPWFPGEPNGTATDRCILTNWFSANGLWNDAPCSGAARYIIEFGGVTASIAALAFDNVNGPAPARAPIAAAPAAQLPDTGSDAAPLALTAALALLLGATLVIGRRARTRTN